MKGKERVSCLPESSEAHERSIYRDHYKVQSSEAYVYINKKMSFSELI